MSGKTIKEIANDLGYAHIMYEIEGLYSRYQATRCCNQYLLQDAYLDFKCILGEEIIRCLMTGLDLHPRFNSDENTYRKLMDIPVEMDCVNPYTIRLIAEIK